MTKQFVKQRFDDIRAIGSGKVIEDIELDRCTFVGPATVQWDDPNPSLVVRRIAATRCTLDNAAAIGTRFENITVDHLTIKGGMLYLTGCVFSRVKLSGRIGPLMVIPPEPKPGQELSPDADQAIADAYKEVDWALDISEAEFTDAGFYYVPGDLIRRDPETQFLLRRESLARLDRRKLPEGSGIFLNRFEGTPFNSIVAVAPKRSRQFQSLLEILQGLRDAGVAE
ncbi:hypothetical protein [Streptomyces sp. NBC_00057]|uniref:hypothetical protein n=1 Tax=Streptomyces sp. NBC_00057 TaxID=2975634 RepID=UPI00324DAEB7